MRARIARLWGFNRGEIVSHFRVLWFIARLWQGSRYGIRIGGKWNLVEISLGRLDLAIEPLRKYYPGKPEEPLPWL